MNAFVQTREDLYAAAQTSEASLQVTSAVQLKVSNKGVPMFYGGMHMYWWFVWIFIWSSFFFVWTPMRRVTYRQMRSPMQLLQQRYAAGEITSVQYEEQRAQFIRDAKM